MCQRGDRSIGQVARDFDLTETAVREWVKQAERDSGARQDGGLTRAERKGLAEFRRENRRLGEDVEILKRATAAVRADRIRRDFTADATRLNSRWYGDITGIRTWEDGCSWPP